MQMSQMHYLPIAPAFFAILVGNLFYRAYPAFGELRL